MDGVEAAWPRFRNLQDPLNASSPADCCPGRLHRRHRRHRRLVCRHHPSGGDGLRQEGPGLPARPSRGDRRGHPGPSDQARRRDRQPGPEGDLAARGRADPTHRRPDSRGRTGHRGGVLRLPLQLLQGRRASHSGNGVRPQGDPAGLQGLPDPVPDLRHGGPGRPRGRQAGQVRARASGPHGREIPRRGGDRPHPDREGRQS